MTNSKTSIKKYWAKLQQTMGYSFVAVLVLAPGLTGHWKFLETNIFGKDVQNFLILQVLK